MDVAASRIEHGADIAIRAGHLPHGVTIEQADRHAAADALHGRGLDGAGVAVVIGGAERAVLAGVAGNAEAADQLKREDRRVVGKRDHARAEIGAEFGLDRVGVELQAGIELAAIIAGSAPARLARFQHDRLDALFGEMQGGREPGKAAADNRHGHAAVGLERRQLKRWHRGCRIEARRQGKRICRDRRHVGIIRDAARGAGNPACADAAAG
jgi:hypothetical protein